ncbi:MAG: hypothetical protein ABI765_08990 [Gemmatimonadota bacterium]
MANRPVIVACIDDLVYDTTNTDGQGHFTVSLFAHSNYASINCNLSAPDAQHPVAFGSGIVYFDPSNEPHPIQIINLLPVQNR